MVRTLSKASQSCIDYCVHLQPKVLTCSKDYQMVITANIHVNKMGQ